ncbi:MAG: F0F1 ATP synthase subunit B family protein [Alphaproteobacteria bacterium]
MGLGVFVSLALPGAVALAEETKKSGMPQLDPSTFASQLFWLAVTFGLFLLIVWRVALPKIGHVLEDRRERIERDIARAGKVKDEAEQVLQEYERRAAEGRAAAQGLIREETQRAAAEAAADHKKLGARLNEEIAGAEARIAKARKSALGDIAEVAGDIAASAAERLIGVKIDKKTAAAAAAKAVKEGSA